MDIKKHVKSPGIGIYGSNGHQVSQAAVDAEGAYVAGIFGCDALNYSSEATLYKSYDEMLTDERVELISICEFPRKSQSTAIIKALHAGKHVYAEKPCVMSVDELDYVLDLSQSRGLIFCEMAGTIFDQPYAKAKEIVDSGILGDIVQIFCQKSYPYGDWRPQNEDEDGGLVMQSAIYGLRFIEHIAGLSVDTATAFETTFGNPGNGGLRMATGINIKLTNGGLANIIANYLNQPGYGAWGFEELRIFGTNGILRTDIRDLTVELIIGDKSQIIATSPIKGIFSILVECIRDKRQFPINPYELTMPTRDIIKIKQNIIDATQQK